MNLEPDLSYLTDLPALARETVKDFLREKNRLFFEENLSAMRRALAILPETIASYVNSAQPVVTIGRADDISANERLALREAIEAFCPWRKGPFSLFGEEIDAEWRSDFKYDRFKPYLGNMQDSRIADIGSNNGYFLFRMAAEKPALALGFEPTRRFVLNFRFLNKFAKFQNLHAELLGFEELKYFNQYFSHIFLMGILYHHSDPLQILKLCHGAMVKGAQLNLETMGIPGKQELCIFPQGRYAGVGGVYFVPDEAAVQNMLKRSGFKDIQCIYNEPLSPLEQRSTQYAHTKSFADFMKPDLSQTAEGYPPVHRIYFTCRK